MANIVVQDDKILRFLQVILDPNVATKRVDAFRDYLAFDVPDPDAWFEEQRQAASAVYPSRIVMVGDEDAMRWRCRTLTPWLARVSASVLATSPPPPV